MEEVDERKSRGITAYEFSGASHHVRFDSIKLLLLLRLFQCAISIKLIYLPFIPLVVELN